ncbi:MAG: glycosyl hydrolase-related protein, partial [Cellulosilyticaceae bacterium]
VPLVIRTYYTLEKHAQVVKVKTVFDNQALDHRLRVLFKTHITSPYHYADSIFEVAQRDNVPSKEWKNPCNAQHQQNFINIHDEHVGLTIANKGLNEYEVLRDGEQTIAVTLHRGTRELGDWGVFPTPEAQCLGESTVEFAIIPHGKDPFTSYETAQKYTVPLIAKEAKRQAGEIASDYRLMHIETTEAMFSSLKVNEQSGAIIGRWYNLSAEKATLKVASRYPVYRSNLLEEYVGDIDGHEVTLGGAQIVTIGFKR